MSVYKCKYFKIQELVCNHVMQSYSEEQIWSFLDEDLKKTLDIIREILGVPLTINQPKMKVYQRGLRLSLIHIFIDQYADICFIACQRKRFSAMAINMCIDTGYDSLSGSFFVSGGSIYLSGKRCV